MSEPASNLRLGHFVEIPVAGEMVPRLRAAALAAGAVDRRACLVGAAESGGASLGASGRHHNAAPAQVPFLMCM